MHNYLNKLKTNGKQLSRLSINLSQKYLLTIYLFLSKKIILIPEIKASNKSDPMEKEKGQAPRLVSEWDLRHPHQKSLSLSLSDFKTKRCTNLDKFINRITTNLVFLFRRHQSVAMLGFSWVHALDEAPRLSTDPYDKKKQKSWR